MTPAAAYGRDCLSITLGDGDEEKFMDNVRGCVRPPASSEAPHPLFCCALWKKLIKTGCKWRWAVGDEHVGVEQWSGKSKYTRPQRENWQKGREGRPRGTSWRRHWDSKWRSSWEDCLLNNRTSVRPQSLDSDLNYVYFLIHWFKT